MILFSSPLMDKEKEIELFNNIINKGCCKRCALRYLGEDKTLITFEHPNTSLANFGLISPVEEFEIEPPSKIQKVNPCIVCLGLLQDTIIDEMLSHENLSNIFEYQHTTFVAYITFPRCILVRDHSMRIHLKRTFPELFNETRVIKMNNAWRYTVENKLSRFLKKTYSHLSKLTLHFYTEYILDEEETATVQPILEKNCTEHVISKHIIHTLMGSKPTDDFSKLLTVPPRVPLYGLSLKDVKYFSEPIHFIGSYCKYSRNLLQVPYIADNEVVVETSIESMILTAIKSVAGNFKDMSFKASSFDEQSVRVLGNGRTFRLQFIDPKFELLSQSQCQEIEEIIKKNKDLLVKNFRQTDRRDIIVLMDSEQQSPRSFKLLCIVYSCKNIDYCVNAINMYTTLNIQQKTPIRNLHQRPNEWKKKKIFFMKARKVKDNLIEMDLCVQSGFYVHEFVHGDFGRTRPSLCEITKAKVEVLALDVVDLKSTLPCAADEEEVVI